jgi:hypothetical protein
MWRVFLAAATGERNLLQGVAGQDAGHWRVADQLLVAVVCDGAGSVREGQVGADHIARALTLRLASTLAAPGHALACGELETTIPAAIEAVRAELAEHAVARDLSLNDFSCTLVGCVCSAGGGFFFHIGDGFAIHQSAEGVSAVSRPENGEFADETYFVTDENWQEHLRFTPLPAMQRGSVIGLLSDGTAPFAVNRTRDAFSRPFIDPIMTFLNAATETNGNVALRNLLESRRASEISSDDKTLLLAVVV